MVEQHRAVATEMLNVLQAIAGNETASAEARAIAASAVLQDLRERDLILRRSPSEMPPVLPPAE